MGKEIKSFEDIDAWQLGMELAERIYVLADSPRLHADKALWEQIHRAVTSIPSNIAEGHELPTRAYRHHVRIALGSLSEIDTQVELIGRLSMLPAARVRTMQADVVELRRLP